MDSVRKFKKLKFSRKREERGNNGECSKDDVEPNPLERIEQLEHIKSILCRNIIEIQNTCEEKDREMDALRGKVTELENTLKQKDIGRSQVEPNLLESNEEEERGNNGEYSKEHVEPNPLERIEQLEHIKSILCRNIIEIQNICEEKDREMDALRGKVTELENTLKQKDIGRSQLEPNLLESNEVEERGNNGEYSKEDVEPNPLERIEQLEHVKSILCRNIIEIVVTFTVLEIP